MRQDGETENDRELRPQDPSLLHDGEGRRGLRLRRRLEVYLIRCQHVRSADTSR
jgi:hypothetical protein